jgi:hypothetical protein
MAETALPGLDAISMKQGSYLRCEARTAACARAPEHTLLDSRAPANVSPPAAKKIVEPVRRRAGQMPLASQFVQTLRHVSAIGSRPPTVPLNIFRIACASR